MILAVDYLHRCNIIHTGTLQRLSTYFVLLISAWMFPDIKPDNIMMSMSQAEILKFVKETKEVLILNDTLPDGSQVTRVSSTPILYSVPDGDVESPAVWRNVIVKLGDVGVCKSTNPIHACRSLTYY
jgi:serine/threonine protein kinase